MQQSSDQWKDIQSILTNYPTEAFPFLNDRHLMGILQVAKVYRYDYLIEGHNAKELRLPILKILQEYIIRKLGHLNSLEESLQTTKAKISSCIDKLEQPKRLKELEERKNQLQEETCRLAIDQLNIILQTRKNNANTKRKIEQGEIKEAPAKFVGKYSDQSRINIILPEDSQLHVQKPSKFRWRSNSQHESMAMKNSGSQIKRIQHEPKKEHEDSLKAFKIEKDQFNFEEELPQLKSKSKLRPRLRQSKMLIPQNDVASNDINSKNNQN